MPMASTMSPLTKMARVKPQKAGPQMRPICSLVRWNAPERSPSMSPRMAKTIEVVRRDRQLATNRRRTFISSSVLL